MSDLVEYLEQTMVGQYTEQVGDDEFRQRAPYVKSYLVESHQFEDDSLVTWLRREFAEATRLQEPSLLRVSDMNGNYYFVDRSHGRYVIFHTIADVRSADPQIERLTEANLSGFDRAWIPTNRLQESWRGHLTGFRFRFEKDVDGLEELVEHPNDIGPPFTTAKSRFRMHLSEQLNALGDLRSAREANLFRGRTALEQVQFHVFNKDTNEYIKNGLYANGKLTGHGTSIQLHLGSVLDTIGRYRDFLDRIEGHALGWIKEDGSAIYRGEPLLISYPKDIRVSDLQLLAESIFRPTKPFRLIGIPTKTSDERIDIEVVDLHTADQFTVEMTNEWMRVYLPFGACGNTVARLYVNMQHAFHSEVSLLSGSGEYLDIDVEEQEVDGTD